jgi:hypothetical protein
LSCQTHQPTVDIWSAGELFKELQDKGETLPCVSDPALYLRVLWPKLDKLPMPKDHLCQKNPEQCIREAKQNFCESELLEDIEREKDLFKIP